MPRTSRFDRESLFRLSLALPRAAELPQLVSRMDPKQSRKTLPDRVRPAPAKFHQIEMAVSSFRQMLSNEPPLLLLSDTG